MIDLTTSQPSAKVNNMETAIIERWIVRETWNDGDIVVADHHTEMRAYDQAFILIGRWIHAGGLNEYSLNDLAQFHKAIELGKFADALEYWNKNMCSCYKVMVSKEQIRFENPTSQELSAKILDYIFPRTKPVANE